MEALQCASAGGILSSHTSTKDHKGTARTSTSLVLRSGVLGENRYGGACSRQLLRNCPTSQRRPLNEKARSRNSTCMSTGNGVQSSFDYDLIIIGAGVGGHGAAVHAVEQVGLHVQSLSHVLYFSSLNNSHRYSPLNFLVL